MLLWLSGFYAITSDSVALAIFIIIIQLLCKRKAHSASGQSGQGLKEEYPSSFQGSLSWLIDWWGKLALSMPPRCFTEKIYHAIWEAWDKEPKGGCKLQYRCLNTNWKKHAQPEMTWDNAVKLQIISSRQTWIYAETLPVLLCAWFVWSWRKKQTKNRVLCVCICL